MRSIIDIIERFARITLREWSAMFRDPVALIFFIVAIILYAVYYPLPYVNELANKAPVGIVDYDRTAMSGQLVRTAGSMQQDTVVEVYDNEADAQKALADEKIYGYLKIPAGMESELRKGNNVKLGAYCHGAFLMLYGNVATAFVTAATSVGATVEVKRIVANGSAKSLHEAMAIRDPLPMQFYTMYNGALGYGVYVVPAVLMLVLQQTCLMGIGAMGGPRKGRKFKFFKDKQDSENEPLLMRYFGRSLAYLLHYIVCITLYKIIIYKMFGFPDRGDYFVFIVFAAAFFGAVINMGMWFAQFFERRETGMQLFLCVPILVLFVTGFSWPRECTPMWLRVLGDLIPSTFAIPAWLALENMGADLYELRHYIFNLYGLSIFYLVLGLLMAKRRDLLQRFRESELTTNARARFHKGLERCRHLFR